jgi:hypothetical protein
VLGNECVVFAPASDGLKVCREVWSATDLRRPEEVSNVTSDTAAFDSRLSSRPRDPEGWNLMHTSKVKVLRGPITFGGWKGQLTLDGDTMTIEGSEVLRSVVVSLADVKKASFNSNNGLWAFRLRDAKRLWIQSAGGLLSADRTAAGAETNRLIADRLAHHRVRVFGV